MYALVNTVFGFAIGKVKRNGKTKGSSKYYQNPMDMMKSYGRLSSMQKSIIIPAWVSIRDATYEPIKVHRDSKTGECIALREEYGS